MLILLELVAGWVPSASLAEDRPNVIFILADDLGINDLSCYGRKDQHTPRLDKLAQEGIRFTSSYCAQPICSPSRAAIMTGKAPARLHLTTFLPGRPDAPSQELLHPKIEQRLPVGEVTLGQRFKAAGYATACIGKWHLGEGPKYSPGARGFDFVHAGRANTRPSATEGGKGEFDLTQNAIKFMDENKSRPFFLYLAHNTPHIPLGAQADRTERYKNAFNPTYAAMIDALDETVGMIVDHVEKLGLTQQTLIIFTSDNGGLHVPELQEDPATHNTPFRAGKGFVYEGGLRVPLIMRWPGHIDAGRRIDTPVINTDWTATFIDVCSLEKEHSGDGHSLMPFFQAKNPAPAQRTFFWHFPHYTNQGSKPAGAVREGRWKLIEHYEDNAHELYDLQTDPGESHDLSSLLPAQVKLLAAKLDASRNVMRAQTNLPNPDFDAALYRRIYVDFDVSKLKPAATAKEMRPGLLPWRTAMDAVVRRPSAPAKAKAK